MIILILVITLVVFILIKNSFQTLSDQQICENNGGKWQSSGQLLGSPYFCNDPTTDAGKSCSDSSECESGLCEAQTSAIDKIGFTGTGNCYGWVNAIWACSLRIENSTVSPGICP